jgi:hypothetical protein
MTITTDRGRWCGWAGLLILVGIFTPPAEGKLVLETRFVDRSGQGQVQVGDVFHFDVLAVITGRNGVFTDEALQSIHGRFLSTDVHGGFLRGNLDATPVAPYNDLPSTGGMAQDLDGDGDLDRGGTDPASAAGWFVARVSPFNVPFSTGKPQEFKFARLDFTVTEVLEDGREKDTLIQFEQRPFETAGLWYVDGLIRDWTHDPGISGGGALQASASIADPDGFFFPPASLKAALPEPGCLAGCAVGAMALLLRRRR